MPIFIFLIFLGISFAAVPSQAQWEPVESGTIEDLIGIALLPVPTGYYGIAIGHQIALRTTDEGRTWQKVSLPTQQPLVSVTFSPTGTGWILGRDGAVLYSQDSGSTWLHHQNSITEENLEQRAVIFTDSLRGFITGVRRFLRTTNGGATWDPIDQDPVGDLRTISFPSNNIGYGFGWYRMYTSSDGGASWEKALLPADHYSVLSYSHFFTPLHGIVIGWGNFGPLIKTYDGGKTWHKRYVQGYPLSSGCFVNNSTGYVAAGYHGVLKTTDQGETWEHYMLPNPIQTPVHTRKADAWGIDFIDENNGITVGGAGVVYRTGNGGGIASGIISETEAGEELYCEYQPGKILLRGKHSATRVSLHDINGRLLITQEVRSSESSTINLPYSLTEGIYFISLTQQDGSRLIRKILIR